MRRLIVFLMMFCGATIQFKVGQAEETAAEKMPLMSRAEKVYNERLEQIRKERAMETNRFKKKAIANTEAREKKHEEILKRKSENESRFQKEAREEAEREKIEQLQKEQEVSESRFTEMAKKRAEKRALKKELREQKLHRNKDNK